MARRNNQLEKENRNLKEKLLVLESSQASAGGVSRNYDDPDKINISKPLFYGMLLLLFGLIGFTAYSFYNKEPTVASRQVTNAIDSTAVDSSNLADEAERKAKDNHDREFRAAIDSTIRSVEASDTSSRESNEGNAPQQTETVEPVQNNDNDEDNDEPQRGRKYTLSATRAYFYDSPDESSRSASFLAKWNNPELTAIDDRNGFIYVEFFTINGQVTKGWLQKRDLRRIGN
jgi:serine/threonine-protein kinase